MVSCFMIIQSLPVMSARLLKHCGSDLHQPADIPVQFTLLLPYCCCSSSCFLLFLLLSFPLFYRFLFPLQWHVVRSQVSIHYIQVETFLVLIKTLDYAHIGFPRKTRWEFVTAGNALMLSYSIEIIETHISACCKDSMPHFHLGLTPGS
jgi:hypothetical protein